MSKRTTLTPLVFFSLFWIFDFVHARAPLKVTYLYCGQGDAIVIQTPQNKFFLLDSGPNDTDYGGSFDAGEKVVVPFLAKNQVHELQAFILSHPHLDHLGGAVSVLNHYKVLEMTDSGWPSSSPQYLKLLEKMDKEKIRYSVVREGDSLNWEPELQVKIYGPAPITQSQKARKEKINNRSIILKLTYHSVSFLFSGDSELEAEQRALKKYGKELKAQVLKSPHHGSKTSSSAKFLAKVDPEVVIISCGKRNRFGHPHPDVLERYERKGIKVYRTDKDGSIQVSSDGNSYKIDLLNRR